MVLSPVPGDENRWYGQTLIQSRVLSAIYSAAATPFSYVACLPLLSTAITLSHHLERMNFWTTPKSVPTPSSDCTLEYHVNSWHYRKSASLTRPVHAVPSSCYGAE